MGTLVELLAPHPAARSVDEGSGELAVTDRTPVEKDVVALPYRPPSFHEETTDPEVLSDSPSTAEDTFDVVHVFGFDHTRHVALVVPILLESESSRIAVSVEDLLAMKIVAELLGTRDVTEDLKVDFEMAPELYARLPEDRNLVLICSSRRNPVTNAVLKHPATAKLLTCRFELLRDQDGSIASPEQWTLKFGDTTIYSPSYAQESQAIADQKDLANVLREDYALFARLPNPWCPSSRVLIIAGLRAFGTWGAAEFMRQNFRSLSTQFDGRDFALIVRVSLVNEEVTIEATENSVILSPRLRT